MKPIKFPEQNCVYAENQPELLVNLTDAAFYKQIDSEGIERVVACWKLSFWERVRILFTGKLWSSLMTFGKPLTPSYFTTKKSDLF